MLILLILLIFGVLLRACQLDRALGGGDESQVLLEWAYTPLDYIITTYGHGSGGHHVFHTIILRLMILLFGEENAVAIRFPAFIAGIACLWFIYKIARQIFQSNTVAQLALLVGAVCPVHIYYSQTARGYSFLMLFTTLSIFATLKLLQSKKYLRWALLLFLSGFLSVYTQPIAVIFILGLALWILFVLVTPRLKEEFGLHLEQVRKKLYVFLSVFLLIGLSSLFAYWPIIDQIVQTKKLHEKAYIAYSSSWDIFIYFIPNLFLKILPGPLVYFAPFFIVGIFFSNTFKLSYRLLPIILLLTTYLVCLITGLGGYPRYYLFNLPLILIFLAGGLMWFGERLKKIFKHTTPLKWTGYSLMCLYLALSLVEIFSNHFPSMKTYDPTAYKYSIDRQLKKNDLLLVADPKHYLYARSIYKKNLQSIIADNQLGGIKLLVENSLNIEDYKVRIHNKDLPVFYNWQNEQSFKSVSIDRKLLDLENINSISLLPEDFEATTDWHVQSGDGEFSLLKEHKFTGKYSLLARASPGKDMVLRGLFGDIELNQPHLLVLVWSTKKNTSKDKYFMPGVGVSYVKKGKMYYSQIPFGKTNTGMALFIKEKSTDKEQYYWQVHSAIGGLPAGKFSLNLFLNCEAGKSIIYDSLRLFLVSKSSNFQR